MKEGNSLVDVHVEGRVVLLRCDFNEPIAKDGSLADDHRMRAALETIKYLKKNGAKTIIATHVGRPKGKQRKFSTKPHAEHLSHLLKCPVGHVSDSVGPRVEKAVSRMKNGDILVLENLRFYEEEKKNDKEFSKKLARLAHAYVNEAFSNSHRMHASMVGVTEFLPAYTGFRLLEEIKSLSILNKPKKPFVVIMGGAKVSDKIEVIHELAKSASKILIGGAMMFTFLKAQGINIGMSRCEEDKLDIARDLLKKYKSKLVIATDCVAASAPDARAKKSDVKDLSNDELGFDVGPNSTELFIEHLKKAKTVFWNGPMGLVEVSKFTKSTKDIAKFLATQDSMRILGGGDTASYLRKAKLAKAASFVSTGGGAALTFIAKKPMPGLEAVGLSHSK